MFFFEAMRRANADFYTAGPLETLTDEQLADLARRSKMTMDELREHLATPRIEMTCPLCGRPSTHLVGCKGCGGDAWDWEFQEAHGEDASDRLRQHLRTSLTQVDGVPEEQMNHAVEHAYTWGGCLVCAECWHHTLPYDAHLSCPLQLVDELKPDRTGNIPRGFLREIVGEGLSQEELIKAFGRWLSGVWARWVEVWNTVPEGPEREAVAEWRAALLHAAFFQDESVIKAGSAL